MEQEAIDPIPWGVPVESHNSVQFRLYHYCVSNVSVLEFSVLEAYHQLPHIITTSSPYDLWCTCPFTAVDSRTFLLARTIPHRMYIIYVHLILIRLSCDHLFRYNTSCLPVLLDMLNWTSCAHRLNSLCLFQESKTHADDSVYWMVSWQFIGRRQ